MRDRIKELRRVRAGALRPNARNWRTHPPAQRAALRAALEEVGYAGALLARELPDGSLELIDGHLRAQLTPEEEVPVLVLDVSEAEAGMILATLDPLGAMAGVDREGLDALLREVAIGPEALRAMLEGVLSLGEAPPGGDPSEGPGVAVPRALQVVAECRDEGEQKRVYELLCGEGVRCRVLTL